MGAADTLSAPVCSRLMSRRFPTRASSRSASASIVSRKAPRSAGGQSISSSSREVTDALIPASGVRRSCETAERMASRRSLTRSRSSASEASASSSSIRIEPASSATKASSSRRSSSGIGGPASASSCVRVDADRPVAALGRRSGDGVDEPLALVPVPESGPVERERAADRLEELARRVDVPASRASVSASARARWPSAERRAARETRPLTVPATMRKIASASRFSPSPIVKVYSGGVKYQLASRNPATAAPSAGQSPPMADTTTTTSR